MSEIETVKRAKRFCIVMKIRWTISFLLFSIISLLCSIIIIIIFLRPFYLLVNITIICKSFVYNPFYAFHILFFLSALSLSYFFCSVSFASFSFILARKHIRALQGIVCAVVSYRYLIFEMYLPRIIQKLSTTHRPQTATGKGVEIKNRPPNVIGQRTTAKITEC